MWAGARLLARGRPWKAVNETLEAFERPNFERKKITRILVKKLLKKCQSFFDFFGLLPYN